MAALMIGATPALAEGMPKHVGECGETTVSKIGARLEDGTTGKPISGSGSAVDFANGGYQVSYDQVPEVDSSRPGDRVKICLVSISQALPARRHARPRLQDDEFSHQRVVDAARRGAFVRRGVRASPATTPSPLMGEGWGGGENLLRFSVFPPNPPPRGGRTLAVCRPQPIPLRTGGAQLSRSSSTGSAALRAARRRGGSSERRGSSSRRAAGGSALWRRR